VRRLRGSTQVLTDVLWKKKANKKEKKTLLQFSLMFFERRNKIKRKRKPCCSRCRNVGLWWVVSGFLVVLDSIPAGDSRSLIVLKHFIRAVSNFDCGETVGKINFAEERKSRSSWSGCVINSFFFKHVAPTCLEEVCVSKLEIIEFWQSQVVRELACSGKVVIDEHDKLRLPGLPFADAHSRLTSQIKKLNGRKDVAHG